MTHPSLRLAGVSFCFMARGKAHRVLENTQRKAENYIMIYQQIYQTSPNEIAYCEKKRGTEIDVLRSDGLYLSNTTL